MYGTAVEGEISLFNSSREWSDKERVELGAEIATVNILKGNASHSHLLSQADSRVSISVRAKGFAPSNAGAVATFGNSSDRRSGKTQLDDLAALVEESRTAATRAEEKTAPEVGLFPLYATFTPLYESYVGDVGKLKVRKLRWLRGRCWPRRRRWRTM